MLLKPHCSDLGYKFIRVQRKSSGTNGRSVYLQNASERLTMVCIKGERDEQPTAFGVDGIAIALSFRTSALPASA